MTDKLKKCSQCKKMVKSLILCLGSMAKGKKINLCDGCYKEVN